MRVLVACEFSGAVRNAFTRAGHDAMSCDLLPSETAGEHFQGDVLELIRRESFDLMVAHPPCTYLTLSGVRWLYSDPKRWCELVEGAVFFRELLNADIPRIAVENPIMHKWASKIVGDTHTQIVHPWMFGHPEMKATGLWLKGLPPLVATSDARHAMSLLPKSESQRIHHLPPGPDRWRERSRTFAGIAEAMADQWGRAELRAA